MATTFDTFSNGLKQYVVAPLNNFGLGGFAFDVEGETTLNASTEITDHYLEDNSSVQDHIAIRPKRLVLKRYVGEVVYQQDDSVNTDIQNVVQKLTALSSFIPTLSKAGEQLFSLKSEDFSFNSLKDAVTSKTVNQLTDYWAFAKNLTGQPSKQQQAYLYLKAIMEGRILVSVQTPFEFLNNMAIESIVAVQNEETKFVSDFTITLKQIRFAQLISVPAGTVSTVTNGANARGDAQTYIPPTDQFEPPVLQGKAAAQMLPLQNNGVVAGTAAKFERDIGPLPAGVLLPPPSN